MKKTISLIICFCAFFVVSVNAETLNLKLVSENNKVLDFDVIVSNVMGTNNVFEGEVKYNKDDVKSLKLIPTDGWEIFTKVNDSSIKFIALSMEHVAVENTTIFKVNTEVKDNTKLVVGNIATAGANVGVSLDEVTYSYKELSKEENVEHIDTPKVENEDKEEISIPDDELINNIEDVEDKEDSVKDEEKTKKDDKELSKMIVSILVAIAIIALAFIFLFRKRKGGVR